MQNAPIAQLPSEKQHRDWPYIVAALVILVIAALAVVMLANPDLFDSSTNTSNTVNPEIGSAERYLALQPVEPVVGPENPELSAFNHLIEMNSSGRTLYENPEVGQAQRWLEGH